MNYLLFSSSTVDSSVLVERNVKLATKAVTHNFDIFNKVQFIVVITF